MMDFLDMDNKNEYFVKGCKVARGSLEDGLDNIAEYLGLKPDNTLFLHTTVVNDIKVSRKLFYKPVFAHSEILSYSSRRTANNATGSCLYVNPGLYEYFNVSGISPSGNILKINNIPNKKKYPYLSVSAHFKEQILENPDLINRFKGFTIVSSFLSQDDIEIAKLLNGKLIMNPEKQSIFNSKYHFRKMSDEYGFAMPPGISFLGINGLDPAVEALKNKLRKLATIDNTKFWIKFESQTSGEGSLTIDKLDEGSIDIVRKHILDFSKSIQVDEEEIKSSLPLVLELDVSSIPDEKEFANIGVQAVLGKDGITLLGATSQISKDGKYIGSAVDETLKELVKYAEDTSIPAFATMQEKGYRGYMTIDVLLVKNIHTGEIKGYNIDPNARFTAGTPLLSILHHSIKKSGKKLYGFSYSNAVRSGNDVFDRIKDYAGEYLYMGPSSDYEGIVPLVLNDKTNIEENKYYLRTAVISQSMENAEKMYMEFKKRLIADL
jgi:type IV secretory pathway protease TraF